MESIRKRFLPLLTVALFLTWGNSLYGQNIVASQLGTEIQSLEQRLSRTGISAADRHDALIRLAQLRQLSGNLAGAAANWLEVAAADPNNEAALVSGAYCLAAIGEWERAALAIRPLLALGKRGPAALQARYLDACFRAWSLSDASALAALAADFEFAALRPLIYYTLLQTVSSNPGVRGAGSAEQWKSRLLAEFPKSPEARVVSAEQAASSAVSAVQSPLWLLLPGAGGSVFAESATLVTSAPSTEPAQPAVSSPPQTPPPQAPPQTPSQPASGTSAAPSAGSSSVVVLQTGLFSREANARTQVETLQKAGFSATISRKLVNGVEHWAVTVPAGQDTKTTTQNLKNAGFDSFPTVLQ